MEELQRFVFAGANEVRVVMQKEKPWFVVMDACKTLGIRTNNVRQIVGDKRLKEANDCGIVIGNHGGKAPLLVNESGLYKLIWKSRKPKAEEFQDWVTDEVLPSIRKHGAYMTESVQNRILENPEEGKYLAELFREEREKNALLEQQVKTEREASQKNFSLWMQAEDAKNKIEKTLKEVRAVAYGRTGGLTKANRRYKSENAMLREALGKAKTQLEADAKAITYLEACFKKKCSHKKKEDRRDLL